ncbi:tyrosine-type recombinase/integrase [Pseudodesulfovibrio tunisiensis]|uniref:tyrosine-type recombinase/integrase n=1 Tax=Pseudodesulfovibrio tunisiensis TaxID=463192 RepID=UPI001FB5232F|nr:site-specific integrase [Pseudodesulfovibrio tunisiensis]
MAFQKKGSQWWYVTVRERDTGRVLTFKAKTRSEADALALEYRAKKKRKDMGVSPIVGTSPTFRELAVEHLRMLKPETAQNELYYVNQLYIPLFGHKPIEFFTSSDLRDALKALQDRGLKPNTIKRRMGFLRALLNRAAKNGYIENAPAIPVPCGEDEVIVPPSRNELKRLLEQAPPHLFRAILLAVYTGIRAGKSELLALTWADVDMEAKTIRVTSAKKGGLPWREIPIAPQLFTHLRKWKSEDEANGDVYLIHYKGKHVASIKKAWNAAKERAGITRRLRMYDLRHAFVTNLVSAGVDLTTAAYLAGHADPSTTAKVYRHIQSKDTQEAIQKVGAIFTDSAEPSKK